MRNIKTNGMKLSDVMIGSGYVGAHLGFITSALMMVATFTNYQPILQFEPLVSKAFIILVPIMVASVFGGVALKKIMGRFK